MSVSTRLGSRQQQEHGENLRSLWNLTLPWMLVMLLAFVGAGLQQQQQQQHQDDNGSNTSSWRLLGHEPEHVFDEEHPPLFPLTRNDFVGFFLAIIGLMLAAGGGIGGGGILVPIYCLVMGFSPKHAIPLSNITVFGGSVANTILNVRKRHPLGDRPLVDWDLILVMEPLTIAGALIGAFLNKVLPELLLTVLLVILLSFTSWSTLKKAIKMYRKETAQFNKQMAESELTRMARADDDDQDNGSDNDEEDKLLEYKQDISSETSKVSTTTIDDKSEPEHEEGEIESYEERKLQEEREQILYEEKSVPVASVMVLVTLFVVVLTINILKGGGAFPSPLGIECGSRGFWISNFLMLGWIVIISIFVRLYLVNRFHQKKRCGFPYVEGDIKWDGRATIVYPFLCCFAGFFAGMFGVGGGIVKGPLMLAMNVHPAVSSASSACMIFFTSFTATTSFVVFGLLVEDYAVICLVIGFIATIAGQVGLSYLAKKAQRNSYIAFSIGGVVLISAFLMTIQSLLSIAEGETHHAGGICGTGD